MISLRTSVARNIALGGLFYAVIAGGTAPLFLPVAEATGGSGTHKVKICHIPEGNPENAHTIEVDKNSVTYQAHLSHGDVEGACETMVTIVATKIVCDAESKLPNWGLGGPDITASTAVDYVAAHPGCRLESNWKFQWGFGAKSGQTGVRDLSGDFIGEADGSKGQGTNTGTGYSDWKTFGPTNASGTASVSIGNLSGATRLWVREVLKDGYVPFTYYPGHTTNADNVSAELYCHTDVLNYDNYDFVSNPVAGRTYFCVAFNAEKSLPPPPPANQKPVITLLGAPAVTQTQGTAWTDPGATVADPEDGDITGKLVTTGTVDTHTPGTYTIAYNATDTAGLAADEKTRTVTVVPAPECADGVTNDADSLIDYPADPGCAGADDNDENEKPVITVLGDLAMMLTVHSAWTDPGATVADPEDGDITGKLVTTGTVDTHTLGTYTIAYNATDTAGLAADEKTRTVRVTSACSDGTDNDGDGKTDFPNEPGCGNPEDNDENEKPVITLLGANPLELLLGASFTDPGANANDAEDCIGKTAEECNTALNLAASGSVDTNTLGTYTITYTARDSGGADADPVIRTVRINPPETECTDGVTNDADSLIDYPADPGCASADDNDENEPPSITLRGDNPMLVRVHAAYVEPSADVDDPEEGDIDGALLVGGDTVDTSTLGTYTVTYNASDAEGAAATERTRAVKVVAACSDGTDNDGDGKTDYPADPGCAGPDDDAEEDPANQKPVITLLGAPAVTQTQGTAWTDPGATVADPEDGDITGKLVTTGTVDTNTLGTYTIAYNATDTAGLAADEKTRTVTVISGGGGGSVPPECADGGDNDGDGKADYPADPGCASSIDDDETDTPLVPPGGGGGGGTPTLVIMNERLESTGDNSVLVTWNTNLPATSRVVYGLDPVAAPGPAPLYGYGISTATATTATTSHAMAIDGLPSGASIYLRPVSTADAQTAVGIELTRGAVLGATAGECFYLREYLRLGANNNPVEVTKLQTFLRDFEGFSTLAVTGFFDIETDRAVRIFQDRYAADVLAPWNLPGNTGYVYYTTQKKINELYCARAFPLSDAQLAEIAAFRALMEVTKRDGDSPTAGGGALGSGAVQSAAGDEALAGASRRGAAAAAPAPAAGAAAPERKTDGAHEGGKDKEKDKEVRLTIADILATVPSVGKKLSTGTMSVDPLARPDAAAVAGASAVNELAAVGEGVSRRFGLAHPGVYVILLFLLLAVVAGGIAFRRAEKEAPQQAPDAAPTASVAAEVEKKAPIAPQPGAEA